MFAGSVNGFVFCFVVVFDDLFFLFFDSLTDTEVNWSAREACS